MIFCQACGARNTDDARFCNMCGARIASSGEPGGPIAPAPTEITRDEAAQPATLAPPTAGAGGATSTTMSGSRVSLEAIGVRSSGRTYAILLAGVLVAMAFGAGGMWIAMRSGRVASAGGETAVAARDAGVLDEGVEEEIEVGDPVTAEEAMPEGVDIVTTGPRLTKRASTGSGSRGGAGSGASGSAAGIGSGSQSGAGSRSGSGGTGAGSASGAGSRSGSGGTGAGSASGAGSGRTGSGGTGTGSGAPSTGSGGGTESESPQAAGTGSGVGSGSGAESGSGAGRDWGAMEEEEERDFAMEGYSNHVRRVIREFYIRRAQSCFDHETARDGEPIRGSVVIGFTIQQSGEVANTSVERNSTGHETLGTCLARQVDQWRLPPPPQELGDVEMQMPFSR